MRGCRQHAIDVLREGHRGFGLLAIEFEDLRDRLDSREGGIERAPADPLRGGFGFYALHPAGEIHVVCPARPDAIPG